MASIKGTLLLAYYHPVIFDLAHTFSRIFDKVEICVTSGLKDNYGDEQAVIAKAKTHGFEAYLLNRAIANINIGKYTLVGLDGVFQGDRLLIDLCGKRNLPYFCINGYPHNQDEPGQNILSFSHFLPQMQYRANYPSEGHVKQLDWGHIAAQGRSAGKNICVFYPEFLELKSWVAATVPKVRRNRFVSFIHRFEECNKESYAVYNQIRNELKEVQIPANFENFSNLSQQGVWEELNSSYGLIHLKHADCPGIALLEAMLMGRVPIVMRSFVDASHNQDLLIDNHSAIICDHVEEIVSRAEDLVENIDFVNDTSRTRNTWLEETTKSHAMIMTDFDRQRPNLMKFLHRCMNENLSHR